MRIGVSAAPKRSRRKEYVGVSMRPNLDSRMGELPCFAAKMREQLPPAGARCSCASQGLNYIVSFASRPDREPSLVDAQGAIQDPNGTLGDQQQANEHEQDRAHEGKNAAVVAWRQRLHEVGHA